MRALCSPLVAGAVLACALYAPRATAQDAPSEGPTGSTPENVEATQQARQHFTAGMNHYISRSFREAIREFQLAAELVPSADLWFNIARSHEQLNEWSLAAEHYQRYLRDRVDPPDREEIEAHIRSLTERAEAERAARRQAPTTGTLRIEMEARGARIQVDDRSVGSAPLNVPLSLAPGRHRLAVLQEGYVPYRAEVRVEAGVTTAAYVDLLPATGYRSVNGTQAWTWVTAGLGGAALIGTVVLGGIALASQSSGDLATARDWAAGSDILLGSAIVLAVTSVILYFVEGRAVATERTSGPSDPPSPAQ